MSNGQPKHIQIKINLDNLEEIACPACNGLIFTAGKSMLRKLPVIQSPTGKPQLVRIDLITCTTCGNLYQIKDDKLFLVA